MVAISQKQILSYYYIHILQMDDSIVAKIESEYNELRDTAVKYISDLMASEITFSDKIIKFSDIKFHKMYHIKYKNFESALCDIKQKFYDYIRLNVLECIIDVIKSKKSMKIKGIIMKNMKYIYNITLDVIINELMKQNDKDIAYDVLELCFSTWYTCNNIHNSKLFPVIIEKYSCLKQLEKVFSSTRLQQCSDNTLIIKCLNSGSPRLEVHELLHILCNTKEENLQLDYRYYGEFALYSAVAYSQPEVVERILSFKSGKDTIDAYGGSSGSQTPLFCALSRYYMCPHDAEIIALMLINAGADINKIGSLNSMSDIQVTVLQAAVYSGVYEVVKLILSRKDFCHLKYMSVEGLTALDIARILQGGTTNRMKIFQLLDEAFAPHSETGSSEAPITDSNEDPSSDSHHKGFMDKINSMYHKIQDDLVQYIRNLIESKESLYHKPNKYLMLEKSLLMKSNSSDEFIKAMADIEDQFKQHITSNIVALILEIMNLKESMCAKMKILGILIKMDIKLDDIIQNFNEGNDDHVYDVLKFCFLTIYGYCDICYSKLFSTVIKKYSLERLERDFFGTRLLETNKKTNVINALMKDNYTECLSLLNNSSNPNDLMLDYIWDTNCGLHYTALYLAVHDLQHEIVEKLISFESGKSTINTYNCTIGARYTPLHCAVTRRSNDPNNLYLKVAENIAIYLIKNGANPFSICTYYHRDDANPKSISGNKFTVLQAAVYSGMYGVVELILSMSRENYSYLDFKSLDELTAHDIARDVCTRKPKNNRCFDILGLFEKEIRDSSTRIPDIPVARSSLYGFMDSCFGTKKLKIK